MRVRQSVVNARPVLRAIHPPAEGPDRTRIRVPNNVCPDKIFLGHTDLRHSSLPRVQTKFAPGV